MGHNGLSTPPHPKSPPEYPDACGKHRLQVAVQSLNQEIDYLQRELNLMEGTVPASRCCIKMHEYVCTSPDPLLKVHEKKNKPCCVWNLFRAILCCNWGSICCTGSCPKTKRPKRCCYVQLDNILCCKWSCMDCIWCNCCKNSSCNLDPLSPCVECSFGCVCSCSRSCAETCVCPRCTGCCKAMCIC